MNAWKTMLHSKELINSGIIEKAFPLPEVVKSYLHAENWEAIDQFFLEAGKPQGLLFEFMKSFLSFESIEHIISIRKDSDDEDGIWHDDGSRILGFSLSLTENSSEIEGGHLRFRKKGSTDYQSVSTRAYGQILIFQTGIYGFEHMVSAVTRGRRVVIAGWCS